MRRATILIAVPLWFLTGGPVNAAEGLAIPTDPVGLILQLGLPMAAVVAFVLEIIGPKGRWTTVEKQRDEAIAGWKAQTDATKSSTEATNRLAAAVDELVRRQMPK